MKIDEQSKEAIEKYKKRKSELIKKIAKYLEESVLMWYDICGQNLRLRYIYPDQKENEILPRLVSVELAHPSHNKTFFVFQFSTMNKIGKIRSDVIAENLAGFPENELKKLLESFAIDEKREITIEEIW